MNVISYFMKTIKGLGLEFGIEECIRPLCYVPVNGVLVHSNYTFHKAGFNFNVSYLITQ